MRDVRRGAREALLRLVESEHDRMMERCFAPSAGGLVDQALASKYASLLNEVGSLPRHQILALRLIAAPSRREYSPDETPQEDERRIGEELLLFRRLADASGYGFGIADIQGNVTYANPALARMFGEHDPDDAIGKSLVNYFPPEIRDDVVSRIIPAVLEQGHWSGELPIRSITGERTAAFQNIFVVHAEVGSPPYLANLVLDISDRKRMEDALRASEENFRALADNAQDGIVIISGDREFVYANTRAAEMAGYSVAEFLDLTFEDLLPPNHVTGFAKMFKARVSGAKAPVHYEAQVLRKNGGLLPISLSSARTTWQGHPASIVVVRDISAQRRAQEALEDSEALYAAVVEQSSDGVIIGQEERVVFANRPIAELLGYTPKEMVGMPFLDLVAPRSRAQVAQLYQEHIVRKPPAWSGVVKVRNKKGATREVEFVGNVIRYRGRLALMAVVRGASLQKRRVKRKV